MTCIVGIAHNGAVTLGADSAGVAGLDRQIRKDRKVFTNGELIFGFTSSFRMGQLLEFNLTTPRILEKQEAFAYAVSALVPALRDTLRTGGYMCTENGRERGGTFLVGFRGRLFRIEDDFQVGECINGIDAVGCGATYALGAMHTLGTSDPLVRLQAGLDAAAAYSAGVAGPFHFVTLEPEQARELA